jgi:putative aldouronate transport system permease protein
MKIEVSYKRISVMQDFFKILAKDIRKNKFIYLMAVPAILYYVVYHYWPMYGAVIAFKNFNPADGILGSPWVGFKNFKSFFQGVYFFRILKNTLLINVYDLLWGFPAPIILALLMNEIKNNIFKRTVQTVTYLPHFISIMVICGIIIDFTSQNGLVNSIIGFFGGKQSNLLMKPELFRPIFVGTNIWQGVGWGSIIYLAALSGIDSELYEASKIDGANRWKQLIHVTIPGILPTIVILLILRMGQMMNVGFEKVMLLYNPNTYVTADVISTFVYRKGIIEANFSYSTAVGLFNSVINFVLLVVSNKLSRLFSETSLW